MMEVSNEIKEDIRKTQSDLKNAIRVHQAWVTRLQEDETNAIYKSKVKEAERDIVAVSQIQKRVVERLRRELETYQQRLKSRNVPVDAERDNRLVAQQLREHRRRPAAVLAENRVREPGEPGDGKPDASEGKENGARAGVSESRSNFANALSRVKETFLGGKLASGEEPWAREDAGGGGPPSDSSGSLAELSPSPSPPPLPHSPRAVSQETFLRFLGLVTPHQKEALERKRSERRKRSTTSTNRNEFVYENYDMQPKRKKNQFPYLQTCTPPTTRSQRLRRQQPAGSRDPSPPAPADKGGWSGGGGGGGSGSAAPAWLASLPAGLTVEPVSDKACAGCGRNDVPSLLVWCSACGVRLHTGCGAEGRCPSCRAALPDPAHSSAAPDTHVYRDKLAERKRLQERNVQLCSELRGLESRAASLRESIDQHTDEKRALLAAQIETQRHLQKLLDVMSHFKDTSVSVQSTSASDSSSERSKSREPE